MLFLLAIAGCGGTVSDLFVAVQEGNFAVAESILAQRPAEVQAHYLGRTVLHLAVVRDNLDMAKLLLQKGAEIEAKDAGANTRCMWRPCAFGITWSACSCVKALIPGRATSSARPPCTMRPTQVKNPLSSCC